MPSNMAYIIIFDIKVFFLYHLSLKKHPAKKKTFYMTYTRFLNKKGIIPKNINTDQAKNTGMAMVLIFLIIAVLSRKQYVVVVAMIVLALNMVYPMIYRPVARFWLGLSQLLGMIVSKVILTVIFFVIVTPVGLIRRLAGSDTLRIKIWKKGNSSVFKIRDHTYAKEDMETPY